MSFWSILCILGDVFIGWCFYWVICILGNLYIGWSVHWVICILGDLFIGWCVSSLKMIILPGKIVWHACYADRNSGTIVSHELGMNSNMIQFYYWLCWRDYNVLTLSWEGRVSLLCVRVSHYSITSISHNSITSVLALNSTLKVSVPFALYYIVDAKIVYHCKI